MSVTGDLYKKGKLSEATKERLIAAHDTYRPLMQAIVAGCKALGRDDEAGAAKLSEQAKLVGSHVIAELAGAGAK